MKPARRIRAVSLVESAFVTEADEMVAVERLDVGEHDLYPVGGGGRARFGCGTIR